MLKPYAELFPKLLKTVSSAVSMVSSMEKTSDFNKDLKDIKINDKTIQTEAGMLLQRISNTPILELKNIMSKNILLSLIQTIYEEKRKENLPDTNFCDFVFVFLVKKFTSLAKNYYEHLLSSCRKYKFFARIRVFARFLGLYEPFNEEDLKFYLKSFDILSKPGLNPTQTTSEPLEINTIPYVKCIECIKHYEQTFSRTEMLMLRMKLDEMKKPHKTNRLGIVDIDEFLEKIVEINKEFKKSTKNFLKTIYEAADLNNDGHLQYKEFELLLRFLSRFKFNKPKTLKFFEEFSENFLSEKNQLKAISFENFCQMNKIHKLFLPSCAKNVVMEDKKVLEKLEKIHKKLENFLDLVFWRFRECHAWDSQLDQLVSLINSIKEKIENKSNPKTALLAYKLIDFESKREIVEERLFELLPNFCLGLL